VSSHHGTPESELVLPLPFSGFAGVGGCHWEGSRGLAIRRFGLGGFRLGRRWLGFGGLRGLLRSLGGRGGSLRCILWFGREGGLLRFGCLELFGGGNEGSGWWGLILGRVGSDGVGCRR
jgi:hypothetical protein